MPAATPQERAAMERAQEAVLKQLQAAELQMAIVKGNLFVSGAQRAAIKAVAEERKRFTTWSTAWKDWALAGREPTPTGGREYSVAFWLRIGGDLSNALRVYVNGAHNADLFTIIKDAAQQTAADVKPGNWPLWLKLAAGAAVVAGTVVIVSNLSRALRA